MNELEALVKYNNLVANGVGNAYRKLSRNIYGRQFKIVWNYISEKNGIYPLFNNIEVKEINDSIRSFSGNLSSTKQFIDWVFDDNWKFSSIIPMEERLDFVYFCFNYSIVKDKDEVIDEIIGGFFRNYAKIKKEKRFDIVDGFVGKNCFKNKFDSKYIRKFRELVNKNEIIVNKNFYAKPYPNINVEIDMYDDDFIKFFYKNQNYTKITIVKILECINSKNFDYDLLMEAEKLFASKPKKEFYERYDLFYIIKYIPFELENLISIYRAQMHDFVRSHFILELMKAKGFDEEDLIFI